MFVPITNFIFLFSFSSLLVSWISLELFYYQRSLKNIHSLSRHVIMHQQNTWYHQWINILLGLSALCVFIQCQTSIIGLVVGILILFLVFDLWFGYDVNQSINQQLVQRYHNPIVGILFILIVVWMYVTKIHRNPLTISCLVLLGCMLCYFSEQYNENEDTTPEYTGFLEFGIFIFLLILLIYSNKHILTFKVSSMTFNKVK